MNVEKKARFKNVNQEARWLLGILVERETLSAAIARLEYLAAARDDYARVFRMVDAELDILKGQTENDDDGVNTS
jgi:hypothetical protein